MIEQRQGEERIKQLLGGDEPQHRERIEQQQGVTEFVCELKFDGTAICLTYRNGKLFRALTRGDGTIGDDVTENVKHISNIPQQLTMPDGFFPTLTEPTPWPEEFEIRGEIYMPWAAFERLNEERVRDEEQPFANPRNAAAGSLRQKDSRITASRGLDIFIFNLQSGDVYGNGQAPSSHTDTLDTIKNDEKWPVFY